MHREDQGRHGRMIVRAREWGGVLAGRGMAVILRNSQQPGLPVQDLASQNPPIAGVDDFQTQLHTGQLFRFFSALEVLCCF